MDESQCPASALPGGDPPPTSRQGRAAYDRDREAKTRRLHAGTRRILELCFGQGAAEGLGPLLARYRDPNDAEDIQDLAFQALASSLRGCQPQTLAEFRERIRLGRISPEPARK